MTEATTYTQAVASPPNDRKSTQQGNDLSTPPAQGNIFTNFTQPVSKNDQADQRLSSSSQNSRSSDHFSIRKEAELPIQAQGPPPLSFSPWDKKTSIILCTFGLLLFDLVLPCTLYYAIRLYTNLEIEVNLGISCACLGLGELLELPMRAWRLFRHPEEYAPLEQKSRWGADFLLWWYVVATVIGIVPYVISTCFDDPILWLFLYAPGLLAAYAVLTAAVSAFPFPLPFRVSSDAKGQRCKPFVYYVIEDFVAVDAGQKRAYREELRARWIASPVFRRLLWDVNLWWIVGGVVFMGALAGITWGCEFDIAYGLSFGVLFIWIGLWTGATWIWVRWQLSKEKDWFAQRTGVIEGVMEKEQDFV